MSQLLTLGGVARIIRKRTGYDLLESWHIDRISKRDEPRRVIRWVGRYRVIEEDDIPVIEAALREAGYLPTKNGK